MSTNAIVEHIEGEASPKELREGLVAVYTERGKEDCASCAASIVKESYRSLRQAEYPHVGDQLDAILKQLNQDRLSGKELVQDTNNIVEAWLAVKNKYPKPDATVEEEKQESVISAAKGASLKMTKVE